MSIEERSWMYQGWKENGCHSDDWVRNTDTFLDHAFSGVSNGQNRGVVCPCSECRNRVRWGRDVMSIHLCKRGFMPGYTRWTEHGEHPVSSSTSAKIDTATDGLDEKLGELRDAMRAEGIEIELEPTADSEAISALLAASKEPLHNRTRVSVLTIVARLMAIKLQHNLSGESIDAILRLLGDVLPENHKMPKNLSECECLLKGLKMPYLKKDTCVNNCKEDEQRENAEESAQGRKRKPIHGFSAIDVKNKRNT